MNFLKIIFSCTILFPYFFQLHAQKIPDKNYFASPLNIPLFLSGNFGELRSSHFHSGIDFKTQQVIGKPVLAAADGYVSRIKIQASSYGKSIYIIHPNGYTTVYAHLNNYIPVIAEYAKNYQYQQKEFEVDIYPEKDKFIFKKGDLIGISGNSGNSGGPHLHFEIRDQAQRPQNCLLFNFNIKDEIKPVFQNLIIYPAGIESFVNGKAEKLILKPIQKSGKYYIPNDPHVKVSGKIGFGIEVYDYLNGSSNKCTIYSIELMVDDTIIYYSEMESFSFDESGYIASYVDYEEKKIKIHRLFLDPNNKLGIYRHVKDKGLVSFDDDSVHHIKITVKDSYKNTSELSFSVQSTNTTPDILASQIDTNFLKTFYYNQKNSYEDPDFKISLPEDALFKDFNFKYSRITNEAISNYSDIHIVHSDDVALFKSCALSLKARNISDQQKDKAVLTYLNKENKPVSIGGEWKDGFVVSRTRSFGKYFISIDTVAPKIVPVIFKNGSIYNENDTITFQIKDTLSGIKSFNGYIDNEWALFEYDMKTDVLYYVIDKSKIEKRPHEILIQVTDFKNNTGIYKGKFITQ